jgi:tRNA A-37 threonylcarbamoyl transferase component Bud32
MGLAQGAIVGGHYRVLRRLGEGGMGSVYAVEDTRRSGTICALKELLDDGTLPPDEVAQARARFTAEIALMRRLRHPYLPRFIESFDEDGKSYFVMEYIPGGTLDDRLSAAGAPLPERDVLGWAISICDALTYLHWQRPPIIVRDLKPGNIIITPSGEARLIDLGIARTYKPGKQTNTENLGTMIYASPEHLGQTQTDPRSDIYSLGATLYHLLTNVEPVPMETPAPGALRRRAPAVSAATEDIVIRCMALDPNVRFQSAADLKEALMRARNALAPLPAAAAPVVHRAPFATRPVPTPTTGANSSARPASGAAHVAPRRARGGDRSALAPAASSPSLPQAPAGIYCPTCGYLNRPRARFCAQDGMPLIPGVIPPAGSVSTTTPVVPPDPIATAALTAQLAREAYATGRLSAALRHCEQAIRQGAADYDLALLRGRILRALGRPLEAAEAFAAAARLRSTAEAYLLEGGAAREGGDLTRAVIALTHARQLDPRDAVASYELGVTCLDLGQLAQAEGELEAALALRPNDGRTLLALARVAIARAEWARSEDLLRRAAAALPGDPTPVKLLGDVQAARTGATSPQPPQMAP